MANQHISRRSFLKLSALAVASAAVSSCTPQAPASPATTQAPQAPAATPPPAKEVTLDVMAPYSEYEGPYREIWNVFEQQNPGIKINLFSINEDTAAAYEAKVAGGYLPAMENSDNLAVKADKTGYQNFIDLATIDFPYFDRWTYDVKNAWTSIYGLPGPRTLDIFQGFIFTWAYHSDLMEKAGLDPYKDVKTLDDLKKWLEAGTAWAKTQKDVDRFWNLSWHNGAFGNIIQDMISLAHPDGQRQNQRDCYLGKKKFNDPDSPYRHVFEFFKEATDKGWVQENWWTLPWEGDMEAGYVSGRSVMVMHGPWIWDKALAANPAIQQKGYPLTPPADGQKTWVQGAMPPAVDKGFFIRAGNEKQPYWEQVKTAFFWFHSPEVVPVRAQTEGRAVVYKLDKPLDLKGPQWQGVLKDIGSDVFPNSQFEDSLTGAMLAAPYLKKGAKGVWDWESNGNNQVYADVMTGKITIQQALDMAQKNWEESYEGIPGV
jgi:ABC-type glycerol-3-phosphate transport system substrate-binding protein